LTNINSPLKLLAESGQKEAMMLAHEHLPLVGIQFHPESCVTENGLLLVKNFMTFIQQRLT
jgi:anthranilate/para-aminobenzoate synthase component II